jgi:repressor LexA
MIKRLSLFIGYLGISTRAFEKQISASDGMIRRAIINNTDIQAKWIKKIADNYPLLSIEWLVTGNGKMLKKLSTLKNPDNHTELEYSTQRGLENKIPLVNPVAIAGLGNTNFLLSDNDIVDYYVIPKFNAIKPDFLIEIFGSSMENEYKNGDIIACKILKESKFIQWGRCHLIATSEQGILIKRIKKGEESDSIIALSSNKDYSPFQIPLKEISGIAIIVGVIKMK